MATSQTTFEEKNVTSAEADRVVALALRGRDGKLTRSDAVAATGLPVPVVEDSLERLLRRYRSHLAVTDSGDLLYWFDPSMARRDEPTLGEKVAVVGHALARAGMWIFKAWIAVTLVAYALAFLALMLTIILGKGGRDDDDRRGGGLDLGWMWWLFWPDMHGPRDPYGRRLPDRRPGRKRKPLLSTVFDFVFGPPRPAPDKLADEREVLAYLREHDGRLVATDLVGLFGWSYRRSEEEITRLLVDYDGEPRVTEQGVIVYEFPSILRTAEESSRGRDVWSWTWDKLETSPPLTANSGLANGLVGGFAAFNLVVSRHAAELAQIHWGVSGPGWDLALTAFPLAFFALFLAIPGTRALARLVGDRGRARRNADRLKVRQVLEHDGAPLPGGPDMKDLALALEGEPVLDETTNRPMIRFPRVSEELAAKQAYLATVDVSGERRLGAVVFSSDDPARK